MNALHEMSTDVPVRVRRTSQSCAAVCNTTERVAGTTTTNRDRARHDSGQTFPTAYTKHLCDMELGRAGGTCSRRVGNGSASDGRHIGGLTRVTQCAGSHRRLALCKSRYSGSAAGVALSWIARRARVDGARAVSIARACPLRAHVEARASSRASRRRGRQRRRCPACRRRGGRPAAASRRS